VLPLELSVSFFLALFPEMAVQNLDQTTFVERYHLVPKLCSPCDRRAYCWKKLAVARDYDVKGPLYKEFEKKGTVDVNEYMDRYRILEYFLKHRHREYCHNKCQRGAECGSWTEPLLDVAVNKFRDWRYSGFETYLDHERKEAARWRKEQAEAVEKLRRQTAELKERLRRESERSRPVVVQTLNVNVSYHVHNHAPVPPVVPPVVDPDSEDDVPLQKKRARKQEDSDDSDDDKPLKRNERPKKIYKRREDYDGLCALCSKPLTQKSRKCPNEKTHVAGCRARQRAGRRK
jgi:hypothetical protein